MKPKIKKQIKNHIFALLDGILFILLILIFIYSLTFYHTELHNVDLAFNAERIRLELGLQEEFQDKGTDIFGKTKVMNITDYYIQSMHRLQTLYPAIFIFLGIWIGIDMYSIIAKLNKNKKSK